MKIIVALLALSSSMALANPRPMLASKDVVAPVVPTTSSVASPQVGMVVFDSSANSFAGMDASGNWSNFQMANLPSTQFVRFGGSSSFSNCSTSPCTVESQSGSWITSVTRSSPGVYTLTIASGTFSARPTCTCSAAQVATSTRACTIAPVGSATTITLNSNDAAGALYDAYVEVICVGPR